MAGLTIGEPEVSENLGKCNKLFLKSVFSSQHIEGALWEQRRISKLERAERGRGSRKRGSEFLSLGGTAVVLQRECTQHHLEHFGKPGSLGSTLSFQFSRSGVGLGSCFSAKLPSDADGLFVGNAFASSIRTSVPRTMFA